MREERECPHCAEMILARAKVCKHCGREVSAPGAIANSDSAPNIMTKIMDKSTASPSDPNLLTVERTVSTSTIPSGRSRAANLFLLALAVAALGLVSKDIY